MIFSSEKPRINSKISGGKLMHAVPKINHLAQAF